MTNKEIDIYIEEIKNFTKELSLSKEKSKEFLDKTGIYTPTGRLTKNYK